MSKRLRGCFSFHTIYISLLFSTFPPPFFFLPPYCFILQNCIVPEIYDQLAPTTENHSYANISHSPTDNPSDEEGYEIPTSGVGLLSTKASTLPHAKPLSQQPQVNAGVGYYQNIPSAKDVSKQEEDKRVRKEANPKCLSGVKVQGGPPPMIDIFEGTSPGETSVCPKVKEVIAQEITPSKRQGPPPKINIYEDGSSEGTPNRPEGNQKVFKAASRMLLPVGTAHGSSSPTVEFNDCSEVRRKSAGNKGAKGANPRPTSANPNKGRELPPPPTAASDSRPKSELGAKNSGGSPSSPLPSDLPPAQAVKNLRSLFE